MIDGIYYAYATALFLLCFGYAIGYIVGRLDLIYRVIRGAGGLLAGDAAKAPKDFFAQQAAAQTTKTKIEIDDRKFVGRVDTDALVKTSENSIGKTTVAQDDIQSSVSKLAQLKGK